jgi:serine/threonine protein kinase/formylglycine-generating enzyme required for sulfatase activity
MSRLVQLTAGSTFAGEYRVLRPLAEGGMGAVYEVEQIGTGALRALKIMHPQMVHDEKLRARFVQEARVSALIESDHVVQVVGAGVDHDTGVPWLAMELLRGETLAMFLARRGTLALWELRDIFSQLCHALTAAHGVGVVHRDLKPENIFLGIARREGISFTVKVLDFGIAKLIAEANQTHTAAIGTPLWMAPEQTEVGASVRPATDVWALGLLAFYCLTGFHYWRVANAERLSAAALLREVVLDGLVPASDRAAEYQRADRIPPGFDSWFARCVVREIDKRFQSAKDAREALEQIVAVSTSGPVGIGPPVRPALVVHPTPFSDRNAPTIDMADTLAAASDEKARSPVAVTGDSPGTGEPVAEDLDEAVPVAQPRAALAIAGVLAMGAIIAGIFIFRTPPSGANAAAVPSVTAAPRPESSLFPAKAALKACPPGMAQVPSGTFFMGSKNDHVTVSSFCIDVNEVKVSDYADCVKKGHCNETGLTAEAMCNWSSKTKDKHPINCVDWDQASGYCHSISKRLPTMEEWEWSARSGEAGTTFPWGDDPPHEHMCWSGSLKRAALGTCEVGSHPSGSSKMAVHDLAGNVAEWVDAATGSHDSVRPLLGDHWMTEVPSFAKDLSGRTTVAAKLVARKLHQNTIGFRCAVTPD